jgi:hypothetical protein
VLDRLTGHTNSGTRQRVYQDREKEEFRQQTAHARRAMRADLARGQLPGPGKRRLPRSGLSRPAVAERLRDALQRRAGVELDPEVLEDILAEIEGRSP